MTRTAISGRRNGRPESAGYAWRRSATEAQRAELEHRRMLLDRQAGYGATGRKLLPPARSQARSAAAKAAAARRRTEAAAPAAAAPEPEPAPQAAPARCRVCKYLVTSIGHRVNCGG